MACSKREFFRYLRSLSKFSIDFYKSAAESEKNKNIFVSAAGISNILSVILTGAAGNTKKEIKECLKLDDIDENTMLEEIEEITEFLSHEYGNTILKMISMICPANGTIIKDEFSDKMVKYYKTDIKSFGVNGGLEEIRQYTNSVVEKCTNDKIKNVIGEGGIDSSTSLIVVSACYFKGNWMSPFDKNFTIKRPFYTDKYHSTDTFYMSKFFKKYDKLNYTNSMILKSRLLSMDYDDRNFSMIFILPYENDGLEEVEKCLSYEKLKSTVDYMERREVDVMIPVFKFDSSLDTVEILKKMGITDLFDPKKIDLSNMCDGEVAIKKMVQTTFIDVNEEGTEAASATSVFIERQSRMSPASFHADHPFIYMIWDYDRSTPYFIGRYVKP